MSLSGAVILKIALCVGLSAGMALLTVLLGRVGGSRSSLWLATALTASAFSGASLAVFLGVLGTIRSFRAMAISGSGGIGSVAAGIWDATQSLRFVAYAATAIAIAGLIQIILRRAFDETSEEVSSRASGRTITLVLLFLAVVGLMTTSWLAMGGVTDLVLNVMNPNYQPTHGVAEMSTEISSRLVRTSALSVAGLLLMLAAVPVSLGVGRAVPSSQSLDRLATLEIIAAIVLAVAMSYQLTTLSNRLHQIALTGNFS